MGVVTNLRKAYEGGYIDGQWELFDLITRAWHGKQCYFKEPSGVVCSLASNKYMTFDQAVDELLDVLRAEEG